MVSLDGRHPGARKAGCIDVRRSFRAQATGIRALALRPVAGKRCQRVRFGRAAVRRQGGSALPHSRAPARSWWPIGPKPATCRQARSRWRLDDREVVQRGSERGRKRRVLGASLEVERRRGFPRRAAGSLQMGCSSRVLVTRNVGCRSGIEASCRCDQGTPKGITRAQRRATEKAIGPDGAHRHSPRRRVPKGAQWVERPGVNPSIEVSSEYVGPRSSFESRPQKVRGVLKLASNKHACQKSGPRLGDAVEAARRLLHHVAE